MKDLHDREEFNAHSTSTERVWNSNMTINVQILNDFYTSLTALAAGGIPILRVMGNARPGMAADWHWGGCYEKSLSVVCLESMPRGTLELPFSIYQSSSDIPLARAAGKLTENCCGLFEVSSRGHIRVGRGGEITDTSRLTEGPPSLNHTSKNDSVQYNKTFCLTSK